MLWRGLGCLEHLFVPWLPKRLLNCLYSWLLHALHEWLLGWLLP